MIDRKVCDDAARIVTGARNEEYGHPEDNLVRTADLWSAYLGIAIVAGDVAKMMVLMKLSRSKKTYTRDNFVDAIGYLLLAEGLDHGSA